MTHLKYILIFIIFLLSSKLSFSQDYKRAIGIKSGPYWGINYKTLMSNDTGYEALIINKNNGITVKGIKMYHLPLAPKKSSQLFYFYGFGGHLGYYQKQLIYNLFKPYRRPTYYRGDIFVVGVDGLLGLEYRFLKNPFTIKMDIQPNFEFFGPMIFNISMEQVGITLSYTLQN